MRRAARSHGVATAQCLRDYYRLDVGVDGRPAVDGWSRPGSCSRSGSRAGSARHISIATPRCLAESTPARCSARSTRSSGSATRTEAIFDFHYRIEIYVPEPKRVYGYYVLPFLLGDQIVARVDLKADRKAGVLRSSAPGRRRGRLTTPPSSCGAELQRMAGWLGLDGVSVAPNGRSCAPALSHLARAV